jgi:lipid-binding SYLF domain-containing protein
MKKTAILTLVSFMILSVNPVFAIDARPGDNEFDTRILEAKQIFEDFTVIREEGIPRDYIQNAKVLLFFPNYVRGGWFFGGKFGLGLAVVKNPETGQWTPPIFIRMGGANFGLQAGVQWTDLILVGKQDTNIRSFLNNRFNVGGNTSAAFGPWGRNVELNADILMQSSFFGYSRSRGLNIGISTEGSVLSCDDDHNGLYYGQGATCWDILDGKVQHYTPAAQELIAAIQAYLGQSAPAAAPQIAPIQAPQPVYDPQPQATRIVNEADQSVLLVTNVVKNVKVYYDYNSADIRPDAQNILNDAIDILKRNDELKLAVSGHTDIRGSKGYNEALGLRRANAVKSYLIQNGIPSDRIEVLSRGKLDALASIGDLEGMQRDRNAHFVVADIQKEKLPTVPNQAAGFQKVSDRVYIAQDEQKMESKLQVGRREYTVKNGDTLAKISQKELGASHRWKYLYELNKDKIRNPNFLMTGQRLMIPVE